MGSVDTTKGNEFPFHSVAGSLAEAKLKIIRDAYASDVDEGFYASKLQRIGDELDQLIDQMTSEADAIPGYNSDAIPGSGESLAVVVDRSNFDDDLQAKVIRSTKKSLLFFGVGKTSNEFGTACMISMLMTAEHPGDWHCIVGREYGIHDDAQSVHEELRIQFSTGPKNVRVYVTQVKVHECAALVMSSRSVDGTTYGSANNPATLVSITPTAVPKDELKEFLEARRAEVPGRLVNHLNQGEKHEAELKRINSQFVEQMEQRDADTDRMRANMAEKKQLLKAIKSKIVATQEAQNRQANYGFENHQNLQAYNTHSNHSYQYAQGRNWWSSR